MSNERPITPPPELVQQWVENWHSTPGLLDCRYEYIATQAVQWGADQELEACCEVLARELICDGKHVATDLRAARRPKPPSLKEQALEQLACIQTDLNKFGMGISTDTILAALETLSND
jgi:hypothetical protein